MAPHIVIMIKQDPMTSHRAVEGLRIALGLSTGPNPLTIILLGQALILLSDEVEEVIDAEILEKHLPVIQELQLPIVVPREDADQWSFDPGFAVQKATASEIASIVGDCDRAMFF